MTELALVMVSYNCADWIDRCLDSLPAALAGHEAEVVVVDNASTDDSAELVATKHPDATLLRNKDNRGFAAAVNQGVAASSAPWVLLLNPDMDARAGSLGALLDFAEANPGHGIYGGRTLRPDGTVERSSCWNLPTVWSTACFALGLSTLFPRSRFFDPESIGGWDRDSVREVGMVTGCLLLVPRTTWDRLGGLDERYFVYGEDADFSARARAIGCRPIITPATEVVHAVGVSSSSGNKTVLLLAGKLTYARTHFSPVAARLVVGFLRLGVAARSAGAQLTGRGKKWAIAWQRRTEWWNGFGNRTP
jgi:N-acetylglucosaminyl-diphospho-decaprenol L-rhamnosyltransferase